MPVTIVALAGSGTVVSQGERLRMDAAHVVVLAAKAPHSVEADAGADLVLLVHHLGTGGEHAHRRPARRAGPMRRHRRRALGPSQRATVRGADRPNPRARAAARAKRR